MLFFPGNIFTRVNIKLQAKKDLFLASSKNQYFCISQSSASSLNRVAKADKFAQTALDQSHPPQSICVIVNTIYMKTLR